MSRFGTGSLGWTLCEWQVGQIDMVSNAPSQVIACGVRIFKDGFQSTKSGEESLNANSLRLIVPPYLSPNPAHPHSFFFWPFFNA